MVSTAPQRRRRLPPAGWLAGGGRRMGRRQSKGRERAAYRTLNALSFLASPHLVADQCRAKANERSNSEVLHFQIAD
jgi:hypothetical protein